MKRYFVNKALIVMLLLFGWPGVGMPANAAAQPSPGDPMAGWEILEIRLEEIEAPADNPVTVEKAALGARLFFDDRLSGSNTISCAHCHHPDKSYSDGLARSRGDTDLLGARRAPALNNLAGYRTFMWDGRSPSLEAQVLLPVVSHVEMNQAVDTLLQELDAAGYRPAFEHVFGDSIGLSPRSVEMAIASFERTLISHNAPFDRYMSGDAEAMTPAQLRGKQLFETKARCITCHEGPHFTDHSFHNIGVDSVDVGRYAMLPLPSMKYAFKTPGLRDAARRGPFFHDGSVATLRDVVIFYNEGGRYSIEEIPNLAIEPLGLTTEEIDDLVAFVTALNGSLYLSSPAPSLPLPARWPASKRP